MACIDAKSTLGAETHGERPEREINLKSRRAGMTKPAL